MRLLISLIVVVYLVGVGVVLSPTIQSKWNSGTAAELSSSVVEAMPGALAWPVRAWSRIAG